ncbi:Retinoic acid induced 14 [Aphanomyces cochlioides]|nr:Retinoic acid induced 14 [Aphanomyces cochlioides]
MSDDEELERGAELRLAQRHRVIIPGALHGLKLWEAAVHSPATTGQATLQFGITGALPKESTIVVEFPDAGWRMELEPNITIKASLGRVPPRGKAHWDGVTLCITTLDEDIEAGATLTIVVSGVTTPACATAATEMTVTTFEKKIIRSTVPPSIRGGQIIDGPSKITIPTLPPGSLHGATRWMPFNSCPNAVADVLLELGVSGAIPTHGKILVELAVEDGGWEMPLHPSVTAKVRPAASVALAATWTADQHVLELVLTDGVLPMGSIVQIAISSVKNPPVERQASTARVTTLVHQGGVIDGPGKIQVARISALREIDLARAAETFNAFGPNDHGLLPLPKAIDAYGSLAIALTKEQVPSQLKLTVVDEAHELPPVAAAAPPPTSKKGKEDVNAAPAQPPPPKEFVALDDFVNFFTTIYTPAFKYGQDFRASAGRGHLDRVRELMTTGCDPNAKDGYGWTALHYAADHGVVEVVDALARVDLDAQDVAGWTPLMCAAAHGHVAVMSRLLGTFSSKF